MPTYFDADNVKVTLGPELAAAEDNGQPSAGIVIPNLALVKMLNSGHPDPLRFPTPRDILITVT